MADGDGQANQLLQQLMPQLVPLIAQAVQAANAGAGGAQAGGQDAPQTRSATTALNPSDALAWETEDNNAKTFRQDIISKLKESKNGSIAKQMETLAALLENIERAIMALRQLPAQEGEPDFQEPLREMRAARATLLKRIFMLYIADAHGFDAVERYMSLTATHEDKALQKVFDEFSKKEAKKKEDAKKKAAEDKNRGPQKRKSYQQRFNPYLVMPQAALLPGSVPGTVPLTQAQAPVPVQTYGQYKEQRREEEIRCHHCQRLGHWRYNCPERQPKKQP